MKRKTFESILIGITLFAGFIFILSIGGLIEAMAFTKVPLATMVICIAWFILVGVYDYVIDNYYI